MKKLEKEEKEEKEEYQLYAWNKKKEKYVPVGKPQPSLNLCKECLSILSKFSNPLIFDEHRTKIYKIIFYYQKGCRRAVFFYAKNISKYSDILEMQK